MKTMKFTCDACLGRGRTLQFIEVVDGKNGTLRSAEKPCPECGGKGSFEYVLFSIEEATELMKRCGMEVEE